MPRSIAVVCASFALAIASTALGAENPPADKGGTGMLWITLLIPIVFIVYLVMLSRRSGSWNQGAYLASAAEHMKKSEEHMARMEAKTDRIIDLLDSIDKTPGRLE